MLQKKCCLKALIDTDEEVVIRVASMQKEDGKMDCFAAFVLAVGIVSLKRPLLEALGRKEVKEKEVDCACSLCPVVCWQIPQMGLKSS